MNAPQYDFASIAERFAHLTLSTATTAWVRFAFDNRGAILDALRLACNVDPTLFVEIDACDCVGPEKFEPTNDDSPALRCEDQYSHEIQPERCKKIIPAPRNADRERNNAIAAVVLSPTRVESERLVSAVEPAIRSRDAHAAKNYVREEIIRLAEARRQSP